MPRMAISEHAVERFVERIMPEMTLMQARWWLEEHCVTAIKLPSRTVLGQAQYAISEPNCVLVAKRSGGDDVLTCVTVFPARARHGEPALTAIERELLDELAARKPGEKVHLPKGNPEVMVAFLELQKKRLEWEGLAVASEEKTKRLAATIEREKLALEKLRLSRGGPPETEKTRRHRMNQEGQWRKLKDSLRVTVRFAIAAAERGDVEARRALDLVYAIDPGYVSDGFLAHQAPDPMGIVE